MQTAIEQAVESSQTPSASTPPDSRVDPEQAARQAEGERATGGASDRPGTEHAAETESPAPWRDRARLAEHEALELKQTLETVRAELRQARESLEVSERRQRIERELAREEAIDIDALSLLTQAALASGDVTDDDIKSAVAELKRKKPLLFADARVQPSGRFAAGPMSPIAPGGAGLDSALEAARGTGSRRDLLTYLRLKRSA